MRRSIPRQSRAVAELIRQRAQRSDAMVVAAALTSFAAFGLVPLLAIATRLAALFLGAGEVVTTARGLAGFVHGPLGLDAQVVAFARSASHAPLWTMAVALVPVSLYAEGTVRSLERFSRAREVHSRTLRGRALTPVFVIVATALVTVTVGVFRQLLFDPFGTGIGPRLLGVFISFNILFFGAFGALLLIYRLFASTALRRGPLLFAAFAAASWIAGQTLGYTVALRAVSGFGNAFGTYAPAGEVAALAFLIYLQHLVFVFGYLLALVLHEEHGPGPRLARIAAPDEDDQSTLEATT